MSETKKCRFWNHEWTPWKDIDRVQKYGPFNNLKNTGIEQERRCKNCGKVQLRIEWMSK
jgi:hypothetical protein